MPVVVRCPRCREVARVEPAEVGLTVRCPGCGTPFVAAGEAEIAPPRRADRPRRRPPAEAAGVVAEPDAPRDHDGGLPVSILIGLALLPFVIPPVWLLAPLVLGRGPALSVAAPLALAVAAAALCLAVVYTVDWSPAARVRGVLILLTVAGFAAVGLYFLKKEHVDWVRGKVDPDAKWRPIPTPDPTYTVEMPGHPGRVQQVLLPGWNLAAYELSAGSVRYVAGSAIAAKAGLDEATWFDRVRAVDVRESGGRAAGEPVAVRHQGHPGRQWEIDHPDGVLRRVVRVYRIDGRMYYLAAEGPNLGADHDDVQKFFASFRYVPPAKKQ